MKLGKPVEMSLAFDFAHGRGGLTIFGKVRSHAFREYLCVNLYLYQMETRRRRRP